MEDYLNLEYLNTFVTAAETGKLSYTAELTYKSHSAVSTQIKKLEEQVGTPLFIRSKNSLTLTKGGEVLLNYAREMLGHNTAALKAMQGKTWDGKITIGIPTDYTEIYLSKILPVIRAKLKQYTILTRCGRSRRIREKIRERQIDFGLVAMEDQYTEEMPLWEEDLVWACRQDFKAPEDYLPVALFADDCVFNTYALYCLRKTNIPFQIIFTSTMMENICQCVNSGQAAALLPASCLTDGLKQVSEKILACPYKLKMGCTWNENTDHKALEIILAEFQNCFERQADD
jgi:DNA-binding transcriptional LysR family regulator